VSQETRTTDTIVEELIKAIDAKLGANRPIVARSLAHGRISWRRQGNGQFDVKLEATV
jgi:hypothetical protein